MDTAYFWSNVILAIITIVAIILGPLLAVKIQRAGDERRAKENDAKQRKMYVFRALMANRGAMLSPQYVEALNLIDIDFYGNTAITNKWKEMLDHLASAPKKEENEEQFNVKLDRWIERTGEHQSDLLELIAIDLGYSYDKVLLKKGGYAPVAHAMNEQEQTTLRQALIRLFEGGTLPVTLPMPDEVLKDQEAIRRYLAQIANGEKHLNVHVNTDPNLT